MKIGMFVRDGVKAELGGTKEKLLADLDSCDFKYEIPFDKINKKGVKETIITMRDPDIEISAEDDVITYIKTVNTEFSNLDKIDSTSINITEHINKIKEQLSEKLDTKGCPVTIEKLDTRTLNIAFIVTSNNEKCRIQIVRDTRGNVYINTITSL